MIEDRRAKWKNRSVEWAVDSSFMLISISQQILNENQKKAAFRSFFQLSCNPDFAFSTDVPFFTWRTVRSALPFISDP